jgi:hypothetical protein
MLFNKLALCHGFGGMGHNLVSGSHSSTEISIFNKNCPFWLLKRRGPSPNPLPMTLVNRVCLFLVLVTSCKEL